MTLDAIVLALVGLYALYAAAFFIAAVVAEILDEIERLRTHRLQPPWLFRLDLAGARRRRRRRTR